MNDAHGEIYYKVLNDNLTCCHGGSGEWVMGEWMPRIEALEPCQSGYHVLKRGQLVLWLGPAIYRVDIDPEGMIEDESKCVVYTAKLGPRMKGWNEKVARMFAADCAEHVLYVFEKKFPGDLRPRRAIDAARESARGKITVEDLDAAGEAAEAAALGVAGAWALAARETAFSAQEASWAARAAAWAARAAAGDAARAAALAAREASLAARAATRTATRDVSWDTAWAVGTAALDAGTAARDAEQRWQTEKLFELMLSPSAAKGLSV